MPRKFRLGVGRKNEFWRNQTLKLRSQAEKASIQLIVSILRRSVSLYPVSLPIQILRDTQSPTLPQTQLSLPTGVFCIACVALLDCIMIVHLSLFRLNKPLLQEANRVYLHVAKLEQRQKANNENVSRK